MGNFDKDLKTGEIGECKAIEILQNSPKTIYLMNTSHDPFFQENDIDCIVDRRDGKIVKYEVKTDTQAHKTGNMVFEMKSNGNVGCLARSAADYVFYYVLETDSMYLYKLDNMKDYIEMTNPVLKDMGDGAKGYLLNIEKLIKAKIVQKVLQN